MNVRSAAMAKRTGKDKGNQNFAVSMLWFAGLVERATMWRRSALRAVLAHLMRMRSLKVKNLVIKVGLRMIGLQILDLRIGGLMIWLQLFSVMELGMMTGGGRLGVKVGVMAGQTLLRGLLCMPLKRLLLLLRWRLPEAQ